jgi:hypothetical protein
MAAIGERRRPVSIFPDEGGTLAGQTQGFQSESGGFSAAESNTKTCPVFRTSVDAALTTDIYRRVPVLINETTGENPWGVSFMRMFDMSNDSHLFRTRLQLEAEGFTLWGNKMVKKEPVANGELRIANGDGYYQVVSSERQTASSEQFLVNRKWRRVRGQWQW